MKGYVNFIILILMWYITKKDKEDDKEKNTK